MNQVSIPGFAPAVHVLPGQLVKALGVIVEKVYSGGQKPENQGQQQKASGAPARSVKVGIPHNFRKLR
jgi:hypothetical protein